MERREFLTVGGATIADFGLRIADWPHATSGPTNPQSAIANPQSTQEPSLSPEVFTRRLARDRKSTRLNSSHLVISYAVFCLKKKNKQAVEQTDVEEADRVRGDAAGREGIEVHSAHLDVLDSALAQRTQLRPACATVALRPYR